MSALVWTPVKVRLGQIRPWNLNPRMSSKAQAQRLIKSERELGQIQTLAVSPSVDGYVDLYDGHQRVSAWLTIKGADFEVLALQSNRPLTEDERRKVSILLHTATGSWNWDALSAWSAADLQEWGMDKDTLAENKELAVVDEFTSVVDRTVAQIGSAAIQKTVRKHNQKFIAVSCHYDIAEWLEPDWVYQPATNEFAGGRFLRRPEITLTVKRVHSDAWQLFRKHHYLNTSINTSAVCFCAFLGSAPVAFTAVLHFPHPIRKHTKREHRTVCLPDYQGVGIGNALSSYIGAVCRGIGWSFISQTSHPSMMRTRARSMDWRMIAKPNRTTKSMPKGESLVARDARQVTTSRIRATFEYIGAALPRTEAERIWNG